jgi:hypothetical protein
MLGKFFYAASFVCFVIGLGGIPDDIQGWTNVLHWLSSNIPFQCDLNGNCGRWLFLLLGLVFIAIASDTHRKLINWYGGFRKKGDDFIPLHQAAIKYYDAAKDGKISMGGAEEMSGWLHGGPSNGSPEDILNWWAKHIISAGVPIYRKRPPSSQLLQIPDRHIKDFILTEGATLLKDPIHDAVCYSQLCVKLEELDAHYNFESGAYTG